MPRKGFKLSFVKLAILRLKTCDRVAAPKEHRLRTLIGSPTAIKLLRSDATYVEKMRR
jgi:hypothetical protein